MTNEQDNVLRILDANINRSEEAMRTIEEYIRFVLNDRFLTETVKQMLGRSFLQIATISFHTLSGF